MWQLTKDFLDYARKDNKGYFYANPNKTIYPNRALYPIIWKGILNDESVEIIQMTDSIDTKDFEFKLYPEKLEYLKNDIVKYINQFLDFQMR
jgi:hypothetical protein